MALHLLPPLISSPDLTQLGALCSQLSTSTLYFLLTLFHSPFDFLFRFILLSPSFTLASIPPSDLKSLSSIQ